MQNTSNILMVRPANFQYNIQTAASNDYQKNITTVTQDEINRLAQQEHDEFVALLKQHGIHVEVVQDTPDPIKPDAIFPNNWISMHEDGRIFLYPMKNTNRSFERRMDIVELIKQKYQVKEVIDLSNYELQDIALEGTGSMVFDHNAKVAYACISPRTDRTLFEKYCAMIEYTPVVFYAYDHNQKLIYHTNVVMCVGEGFVVIGMCSVTDEAERKMLMDKFAATGLTVIDLTSDQLNANFAGNMLQLKNNKGEKFLVMSARAYTSLTPSQIETLERFTKILPVPIYMIEDIGGGSARCMMAEIFCPPK